MILNQCTTTSSESLIWPMLLLPITNLKIWVIYKSTLKKVTVPLDQEKNVGDSQLEDLPELIQRN